MRLISKVKFYSFFVFPMVFLIVMLLCEPINTRISNIASDKVDTLMGCIATLIGVMITVLTIYLSFPKNEVITRRMYKSGHNFILLSNISMGIVSYFLSIMAWLFLNSCFWPIAFFVCAVTNTIVAAYYIMALSVITRKNKIT